jgi:acetyltransferase-like isoleucine patch superfamily enzyme
MNPPNSLDVDDLMAWFEKLHEALPDLPVTNTPRNNSLRGDVLRRLVGEFLTDDERAAFFGLPEGCRIREGAKIISPEKLNIGEYCWIGENAILDASGGLDIGSHTSIGLSVFVWSHSSHMTNLLMKNEISSDLIQRKKTTIGCGVFIGGPSVIMPGVTIGDQVIIRPFSTISGDIPNRSLVDGGKVKEGLLTDKFIKRLAKSK